MTKRAVGLAEYLELTEEERYNILHRDGVYVGKRKQDGTTVVLFQLYGFYVEVFYKQYRKIIERSHATDSADVLQPYLTQIHIRGLDNTDGEKGKP